jgi:hypothetical protein
MWKMTDRLEPIMGPIIASTKAGELDAVPEASTSDSGRRSPFAKNVGING